MPRQSAPPIKARHPPFLIPEMRQVYVAEASRLQAKTKVPVASVSKDRGLQHKTASTKNSYENLGNHGALLSPKATLCGL